MREEKEMEKRNVDVSIIIPVYNAEKYLRQCVGSVLSQQGMQFEILLVDDGSVDQSGSICDAYEKEYENIYAYHQKNSGPAAARNLGLQKARGEYIQFLDADDELIPGYAEVFRKIACEDAPDIIIGGALTVNESKKTLRTLLPVSQKKTSVHVLLKDLTLIKKELYFHYIWNRWYRRDLITRHNVTFREEIRLGEDFLFNCAVFPKAETVVVSDVPMYYYIKRGTQTLTAAFDRRELSRRRLVDKAFIELLESFGLYEAQKDAVDVMLGTMSYQSITRIAGKACQADFREKVQYVREFAESEYRQYLDSFRKSDRCPRGAKMILRELCRGRCGIAAAMILLLDAAKKAKQKLRT